MQPSELKAYWNKVSKEAGIPAEHIASVGAMFENEDNSKLFLDKFVEKPEYSRVVNAGKEASNKAEARLTTATAKINEFDRWAKETALPYAERLEKREKLVIAQVDAYEKRYGKLNPNQLPANEPVTPDPNSNGNNSAPAMTQGELAQAMGLSASNTLTLVTDLMAMTEKHRDRFGKSLDIAAFKAFAEEKYGEAQRANRPITLQDAYNDFTLDATTELDLKERKDEIKVAVDKVKDELKQQYSQTHIPIEGSPIEGDMRINIDPDLITKPEDTLDESERMRGFVEEWGKTEAEDAQTG
jgi:hypothetical protein